MCGTFASSPIIDRLRLVEKARIGWKSNNINRIGLEITEGSYSWTLLDNVVLAHK